MTDDAPGGPDRPRDVLKVKAGALYRDLDRVAAEEPLGITLDGEPFAVIMRTPGHDLELAAGFLHGEGILHGDEDLLALEHCEDPDEPGLRNVVDARLSDAARGRLPARRLVTSRASCGVCGRRTIEEVHRSSAPVASRLTVPAAVLLRLPDLMRSAQTTFHATGGLHAAGLFDAAGRLLLLREDIGRHNAVDKVVGHELLKERLPLAETVLLVSGRAGFEIVEKAVRAGIPVVAAISAPSSLAVELAETAGVAVVGFLREGTFNIYSAPHRIET